MPTLRELQLGFSVALGGETHSLLCSRLVRQNGLSGTRRLQVYRNNAHITLGEALAAVYPVIRRLVGDEFFQQAAQAYLRTHPSRSGDIHQYGDCFADFIARFRGARRMAYLRDVARLEWLYHQIFHSEVSPPLDITALAGVAEADYPQLHFGLQPATRLFRSEFPVLRIWEVNQTDHAGEDSVDLAAGGVRLLIRRRGVEVIFQPLGRGEYQFLKTLACGGDLGQAHDAAGRRDPGFDLAAALSGLIAQGTLCDWQLPQRKAALYPSPGKARR